MSTPASPVSATESNEPLRYDRFLFALAERIAPDPTCDARLPYISGKERYNEPFGLITEEPTWTQEDRDELVELLQLHASTLPPLHGKMTDEEVAAFHRAYRSISERPEWQPHIFSDAERRQLREERLDIRLAHAKFLKQAIAQGRLRLFDAHRLPQQGPQPDVHSFFTREDAQAYLEPLGLTLAEVLGEVPTASPVTQAQEPSPSPSPGFQEQTISSAAAAATVTRRNRKWSDIDKDLAISCHERKRDAEGAERLGIDLSTFKKYVARWKEERDAAQAEEKKMPTPENSANNPFNSTIVRDGKKVAE